MKKKWMFLCFGFGVFALGSSAQQPAAPATPQPAATPTPAIDTDDGRDDILFLVKLTAKELKMDVVPATNVEFPGTKRRTKVWLTERKNMPDKLEPGVTYRDIGMTLRISSRFENIDEIVREALGEPPAPKTTSAAPITPPASVTTGGPVRQAPASGVEPPRTRSTPKRKTPVKRHK